MIVFFTIIAYAVLLLAALSLLVLCLRAKDDHVGRVVFPEYYVWCGLKILAVMFVCAAWIACFHLGAFK